jgi:hypothetical protein
MTTETRRYRGPGVPFQGTIAVSARLRSAGITATKITIWHGRTGHWEAETTAGPRWVTHLGGVWKIAKVTP